MGKPQKQVDVLNDVWDDVNHRLRTDATLETEDIEIGAVEIKDATSDHRAVVDSTGALKTTATFTPSGTQDVNVTNSSLPVTGNFYPTTQPVSATDLDIRNLNKTTDSIEAEISNLPTDYAKDSSLANLSNLDVLLSTRLKASDTLTKVGTVDTITNAVTVQATDLDIHDLSSTRDSIEVKQATANNLNANVSATHLDIRHLNYTDDVVNVNNMIPSVETGLAKDNTLTGGTQRTKLTDGTNNVTVTNNKLDVNANIVGDIYDNLWQNETEAGYGFAVTTNVLTLATNPEQNFLLFKNPNASGKNIRIEKIIFGNTSNKANILRVYRNPTITANGTALAINKLRLSGSASVCNVYKIPTTTSFGTLITPIILLGSPAGSTFILKLDLGRYVEQNENLLITIDPTDAGLAFFVTVYWVET